MTESVLQMPPRRRTPAAIIFGIIGVLIVGLLVIPALAVRERSAPVGIGVCT